MWRGVAITEEPRNEMRAEILENTWDWPSKDRTTHMTADDRVQSIAEIDYM